jgi:hypothetical protein
VLNLGVVLGMSFARKEAAMTIKPDQNISKTSSNTMRPIRKASKGPVETSRLFIDVNEAIRRSQVLTLTRYVE